MMCDCDADVIAHGPFPAYGWFRAECDQCGAQWRGFSDAGRVTPRPVEEPA